MNNMSKTYTLLICGSRTINLTAKNIEDTIELINKKEKEELQKQLDESTISFLDWVDSHRPINAISRVISGGAKGPDTTAMEWAKSRRLEGRTYMARWETYGKSAGILRNKIMVKMSDVCLAFWDGKSKGTEFTFNYALKMGKKVYVVLCTDDKIGNPEEVVPQTEW